jgi:5-oxoprolinase (ATP-hydrolysing) subunit A
MDEQTTSKVKNIDLNCDLGEGYNDRAIMPYISSCNVACGGHFGDVHTIEVALELARQHGVRVGAHPSFPDKPHFGRRIVDMGEKDLVESIEEQLHLFQEVSNRMQLPFHHIKWHGALYNLAARDPDLAHRLADFINKNFPSMLLYVPFGSEMAKACRALNIPVWYEVFADRAYAEDLSLVPRSDPRSILKDTSAIKQQVFDILEKKQVRTIGGQTVAIKANTICVHGDHPWALSITQQLFNFLKENQYHIR